MISEESILVLRKKLLITFIITISMDQSFMHFLQVLPRKIVVF